MYQSLMIKKITWQGIIFLQCPIAEFAKKYNLMHILPLFCNADYCIVGSKNPMAKKYEIVKDENGFLVSQKI